MSKNNLSFKDVYENYLVYATKRHKKQGLDTITQNFNNHILPFFKDKRMNELTKIDILDWQDYILTKNFSSNFNNALYSRLGSFMTYCVDYDYLTENLVRKVKKFPKKIECKERRVYNIWQFIWFSLHLKHKIIKQFFNFMFFYGTRPSEAMALRFSDLDGFKVHIRYNLQRRGERLLDTPKNQSSIRTFKIGLLEKIRMYRLKKYYIKLYGKFDINYFVFGGKKPLSTSTIDRYKHKACINAHIFEITQHEFRHSYASRMIRKGVPIADVSKSMGHSNISTTLDIYTH